MNKLILILILIFPSICHADITTGLTGWWKLNEGTGSTTVDSSGNGYTGTPTGGYGWVTGRIGPYGMSFDGNTGTRVDMTPAISSLFSASTGTIAAWVKPAGTAPTLTISYNGGFVGDAGAYAGLCRGIIGGNDRFWSYNYDGAEERVGVAYTVGQWMHLVWVHTGGNLYIYSNGALVGSVASGNTQVVTNTFRLGIFNTGAGYFVLNGNLDDVRTYSRALSAADVTELYNTGFNQIYNATIFNATLNP